MHPSALLFARLKETKGSFREGAFAQATEGECVQSGLDLFFVEHLDPLYTQLPPSLARLVPPPSAGRQNLFVSRTPHPSRPSHKGSVDPPSPTGEGFGEITAARLSVDGTMM